MVVTRENGHQTQKPHLSQKASQLAVVVTRKPHGCSPMSSQKASQLAVTTASQRAAHGRLPDVRALCRLGGRMPCFKELLAAREELDTQRFCPDLEAPGCRQTRMVRQLPAGFAAGAGARPHHLTAWRDRRGRGAESLPVFECIS